MNAAIRVHPDIQRTVRIVRFCRKGVQHKIIAEQFGTTATTVLNLFKRYNTLPEDIRPGTLLASGLDEQAIRWFRRQSGIANPTKTELKRWLGEDPGRRYYFSRKPSGETIMEFAIGKLGVEPSLFDLGLTISGIRLVGRLTGKEFPFRPDLKKWFDEHPDQKEREALITAVIPMKNPTGPGGKKYVFELESFAAGQGLSG
jgi:hypothetical protein